MSEADFRRGFSELALMRGERVADKRLGSRHAGRTGTVAGLYIAKSQPRRANTRDWVNVKWDGRKTICAVDPSDLVRRVRAWRYANEDGVSRRGPA